jgi:hypothetical protein
MTRVARLAAPVVSLAAVVALAAGCGDSSSPSVASLGSTTRATASSQGSSPPSNSTQGGPGNGGSGNSVHIAMKLTNATRFAACMRSHDIKGFPDPNSQGAISITGGPGSNLDPSSPKFQAAQRACRKVLPNGGQATPAQQAKATEQALAFSACMRKHGVRDFPDPNFSSGHGVIQIKGGPGSDLNPSSPTFQAAMTACRADLPSKIRAGAASPGGK